MSGVRCSMFTPRSGHILHPRSRGTPSFHHPAFPLIIVWLIPMQRTQYIFIDYENVCESDLSPVAGKPAVVFGPGEPAHSHAADEALAIAAVVEAPDVYRRAIAAYFA